MEFFLGIKVTRNQMEGTLTLSEKKLVEDVGKLYTTHIYLFLLLFYLGLCKILE